MGLADRPCRLGAPESAPLATADITLLAREVPTWEVTADRIQRTWRFASFPEAIRFVGDVASVAEAEQHHPDLHVFYDRVQVVLWTHSIGGLSTNDFVMAAKIDRLVGAYSVLA